MNLACTFITILIGSVISAHSFAQQEPRAALFWNQYLHTNPAMTGAIYKHQANAQLRNQWTNINGAPTTLWANYAMKLDSINSGIGVSYEYDVTGLNKSHTALLSYAYHIPIKKMFLSLGASAGIKTMKVEGSKFIFPQTPEPIFQDRQLKPAFQCDFGIALHAEKWNVGISVTQLNGARFKDSIFPMKDVPHFWGFADYTFDLGEKWTLTPRGQVYTDGMKLSSTIALVATVDRDIWFGFSALVAGGLSVSPMVGYDILGKFRVGYLYEFDANQSAGSISKGGTHEILLSYQLK